MKSKFDSCVYSEYFGDYGMRVCHHPSMEKNDVIYCDSCRKCNRYTTERKALERSCPLCGKKVHLSRYCGYWHIKCEKCGLEAKNKDLEKLLKTWRKRS